MISPVRCTHCGKKYDLADVKIVARYADCTVFKSPCCDRTVDDREWKSLPDIERVERNDDWDCEMYAQGFHDQYGKG